MSDEWLVHASGHKARAVRKGIVKGSLRRPAACASPSIIRQRQKESPSPGPQRSIATSVPLLTQTTLGRARTLRPEIRRPARVKNIRRLQRRQAIIEAVRTLSLRLISQDARRRHGRHAERRKLEHDSVLCNIRRHIDSACLPSRHAQSCHQCFPIADNQISVIFQEDNERAEES